MSKIFMAKFNIIGVAISTSILWFILTGLMTMQYTWINSDVVPL
jgi:hypothetical protein